MKTKKEKFNVEKYPQTFAYVVEYDMHKIRCNMCGSVVLREPDTKEYPYQCLSCDENLYSFETHEGEFHTDEELNDMCLNALILELDT
jgi:hypothetical protein